VSAPLSVLGKKVMARCQKSAVGCMEWQGAKNGQGYGIMRANGRYIGTHRISLAYATNNPSLLDKIDTSSGLVKTYVLHSCDNPSCCNPKHLRLGNAGENANDATLRNRRPFGNPNLPRKLSPDDVREIRKEAQTWEGICDMMKKYKVSQMTITEVAARRSHKHVDA